MALSVALQYCVRVGESGTIHIYRYNIMCTTKLQLAGFVSHGKQFYTKFDLRSFLLINYFYWFYGFALDFLNKHFC